MGWAGAGAEVGRCCMGCMVLAAAAIQLQTKGDKQQRVFYVEGTRVKAKVEACARHQPACVKETQQSARAEGFTEWLDRGVQAPMGTAPFLCSLCSMRETSARPELKQLKHNSEARRKMFLAYRVRDAPGLT
eukprot:1162016-Pelagomonas_calceolata.AAC.3